MLKKEIHQCIDENEIGTVLLKKRRVLHGAYYLFRQSVITVDRSNRIGLPSYDFSENSLLLCVNYTHTQFIFYIVTKNNRIE